MKPTDQCGTVGGIAGWADVLYPPKEPPMDVTHWRIEQEGEYLWLIRKGPIRHWANNPEDAVRLVVALIAAGQ